MIKLQPHNIDSGAYAGILIKLYLKKMWWAYSIPAILLVLMGVGDVRFLLLALIYVFLVTPMIMAFAVTFYGLIKESRYSILRHILQVDEQGCEFVYVDGDGCEMDRDNVKWLDVKHIYPKQKYLIVALKTGRFKFFAIPYTAFADKDEMLMFIDLAKIHSISCY